jgi:hypothetical protein
MDIKDQIAGLPEWSSDWEPALIARLALAREWIGRGYCGDDCFANEGNGFRCTCGRDALLAALEVPRG